MMSRWVAIQIIERERFVVLVNSFVIYIFKNPIVMLFIINLYFPTICFVADDRNASQVIMYYKCNIACSFDQVLKIPLINEAREKALAIVGQRWMSEIEYKRRKVAGTLESSSVRASVATIVLHDSEVWTLIMQSFACYALTCEISTAHW